ncbi:Hpt domain protein [Maioricimonas rarisocia]|uniref:Hpt domain protein n=1 Tax=Maioricimonas rarisocia TaxID=2528026 RepID=A0A517ZFT1_9PLAN|nr:Hpt domain-containing protein [Maioricimonas rarisocia]QDU41314.1 Hpt domain protein [Maioricimonas rarisocia]
MSFTRVKRDVALERCGGDEELLQEIAGLFLETVPASLDTLRTALKEGDLVVARRAAHTLKNSFDNLGATTARDAAMAVEVAAVEERRDELATLTTKVEDELDAVLPEVCVLAGSTA